jgi:hypothetical protein
LTDDIEKLSPQFKPADLIPDLMDAMRNLVGWVAGLIATPV